MSSLLLPPTTISSPSSRFASITLHPLPYSSMSDKYLGTAHKYFSLSDYEIDPHCRYRKRIFHEGPPSRTTLECVRHSNPPKFKDFIVYSPNRYTDKHAPKPVNSVQVRNWDYPQGDVQRKRRRESSVDSHATDGSYTEIPPMSPFSPAASVYDGIEDIDDESDDSSTSDRDRAHSSTPGRHASKGKEPAYRPKLPISVPSLPKMSSASPTLPSIPTVSSSITQYSNNRLAERARMATLPVEAQPSVMNHRKTTPIATSSSTFSTFSANSYSAGRSSAEVERYKDRTPPVHTGEHYMDSSLSVRARRATITGGAMDSRFNLDSRTAKQELIEEVVPARSRPEDEASRTVTPEAGRVKMERMTPPLLDLNAPERPYAAFRVAELERGSISAPPEAGPSRSRKRSKSSVSATKESEPATVISADLESNQPRRRGDRGALNPVLKMALESGDYVQVSENGFYCRVHGDHLGGTRSVTRHHESVHLNIMVECQYCNAQFSRRDAVLRHQRQSSCKTNAKWKVGKKTDVTDGPSAGSC
ncbi:hypothetical protein ACEPAF_9594 [Sanghuangporus sanghuang]